MKKILLVNTSRYFFAEGKSLLDRKDFQVFLAHSGASALQIHRQEKVNMIVADLDMQEMGEDTLCTHIRKENESRLTSFILICGGTPAELQRGRHCGANICLTRPFSAKTLLDQVEKLLSISVRRGYRVLMRAKVKGAKDDAIFFCTSQNISSTGLLIEAERTMAIGDQLSCSFYLPGSTQIITDGEVTRAEIMTDGKHQYGIRFIDISPEHKSGIEKFIEDNLKSS